MSHFCVTVRLPAATQVEDFEEVLDELLLPYKEAGCGAEDSPTLAQYLSFHDTEEEYFQEYETKTRDMIRLPSGEEVSAYDNRFRNPELFADPRYIYPEGTVEFTKPHKEVYASFEEFCQDWHGSQRDPKTGRYGYWQNANKKWDYWTIGGRWTGHFLMGYDPSKDKDNYKKCWLCNGTGTRSDGRFAKENSQGCQPTPAGHPVKGEGCNGCSGTGWEFKFASDLKPIGNFTRVKDIDWERVQQLTQQRLDKFWASWQELCAGKEFDAFDGPRDTALALGLLTCKDASELTGKEYKVVAWDKEDTPPERRRNRYDVLKETTKEEVAAQFFDYFSPLSSWARLDAKDGWQEKGEMGWWACSDATPESTIAHVAGLHAWMKDGDPNDWLVIVDCHI